MSKRLSNKVPEVFKNDAKFPHPTNINQITNNKSRVSMDAIKGNVLRLSCC
jgi:hypothetical protein